MKNDKPSATALLIARAMVFLAYDLEVGRLVPPCAAEASLWFMEASGDNPKWFQWLAKKKWFRAVVTRTERYTLPGILDHFVLRKRHLEEITRRCLRDGAAQVVILGAGFDTLALRLHSEFPQVLFLELDHPATQRIKQRALQRYSLPGANLVFIPGDFARASLEQTLLSSPAYRPDADTLFLAEGLLMYLSPEDVQETFRTICEQSGRASRFAFTFLAIQKNGRTNFPQISPAITFWLRWRQEPFRWGIRAADIEQYLGGQGFALREIATPENLWQRYLPQSAPPAHINGDFLCVADRLH